MSLSDTGRPTRGVDLVGHCIVRRSYPIGSNILFLFLASCLLGIRLLAPVSLFFWGGGFFSWPSSTGYTPGYGGHARGEGINRLGQPGAKGKYWISQVRSMALRILGKHGNKRSKIGQSGIKAKSLRNDGRRQAR